LALARRNPARQSLRGRSHLRRGRRTPGRLAQGLEGGRRKWSGVAGQWREM